MRIRVKKDFQKARFLYHYTLKENVNKILESKCIKSSDSYVFFTDSYEKSVDLFEQEMMTDHLYFDLDGKLQKRIPAKKEDYQIIRIPYHDDGEFVRFEFEEDNPNSIYAKSKIHKGTFFFDKAKVFDIREEEEYHSNFFFPNKLKRSILLSVFSLGLLLPKYVHADSWIDEGNYSTSWWNGTAYEDYFLNSTSELAGLNYLLHNNYNVFTYYGSCGPSNNVYFNGGEEINLLDHDWPAFKNIKCGCICGTHRVLLRGGQSLGMTECDPGFDGTGELTILHKYIIEPQTSPYGTVTVDKTEVFDGDSYSIHAQTNNPKYYIKSILLDNSSIYNRPGYNEDVTLTGTYRNNYSHYRLPLVASFAVKTYYLNYSCSNKHVCFNDIDKNMQYGESYDFPISVDPGYEVTNVSVTGANYSIHQNVVHLDSVTQAVTIRIDSRKIPPEMNERDQAIVIDLSHLQNVFDIPYRLEDYALEYLIAHHILNVEETVIGNDLVVKNSENKHLFKIKANGQIELYANANSEDNASYDITDDFGLYFLVESETVLNPNYKYIKLVFPGEDTCNNPITIQNAEIVESSTTLNSSSIEFGESYINANIDLYHVDDYVKIKLVLKNSGKEQYKFDPSSIIDTDHFDYQIEYDNDSQMIEPNSTSTIYINVSYKDILEDDNNTDTVRKEFTLLKTVDNEGNFITPSNPKTNTSRNVVLVVLLSLLLVTVIVYRKKLNKKQLSLFLLSSLLIPSIVDAVCYHDITMFFNINVHNEQALTSRYSKMSTAISNALIYEKQPDFVNNDLIFEYGETSWQFTTSDIQDTVKVVSKIQTGDQVNTLEITMGVTDGEVYTTNCHSTHFSHLDENEKQLLCSSLADGLSTMKPEAVTALINLTRVPEES